MKDPIVITSIARTPIGKMLGALKDFSAHALGSHVITANITRSNISQDAIQEVLLGCVLPAGQGQAPARQAALNAKLPQSVPCTTLNKVCGSGMKAVMFAYALIETGERSVVLAGGMESMTNAPYLLLKGRQGYRLGKSEIYDHMILDGLEDAYNHEPMGLFAEMTAEEYGFTREEQDHYSKTSFERAKRANEDGAFKYEIVPLTVKTKTGEMVIDQDEHPFRVNPDKIPQLKPAFKKDGTVTAGNSSSIADGAAAIILMKESEAKRQKVTPLAKIVAFSSLARAPQEFTTAPIYAVRDLMEKIGWNVDQVDLFEVNEAFAVVTLAFMRTLNVPHDKINIHGGACALGHPIGATGARILVSLIAALKEKKLKRGIATLCIGGGEATAIAIEMI